MQIMLLDIEHIECCKEKGTSKTYDQFGAVGDLSEDNPR